VSERKKNLFLLLDPKTPPKRPNSLRYWIGQKKCFKICQETNFDMGFQKKKHEKTKFEHRFFRIGPVSQIVPLKQIRGWQHYNYKVTLLPNVMPGT
jgi:hypothetical protein